MKLTTLAGLAYGAYYLYSAYQKSQTTVAATPSGSLTVIPLTSAMSKVLTANGVTLYKDATGNYYAQQSAASPYVLPITQANAVSLVGQYL